MGLTVTADCEVRMWVRKPKRGTLATPNHRFLTSMQERIGGIYLIRYLSYRSIR